ncbi:hypothetical protein PHLCEN_2v5495 [Hermanssonia centrifuga]|uniref:Uncharacterized protein n=1 Tax=Hermanssonia centrifuga TaxID=98765 RepID=A0A2R6P290_9APHY|nr:hypothetical protein PHLCEN_2v5495 [Hermanssonia centrifuga]
MSDYEFESEATDQDEDVPLALARATKASKGKQQDEGGYRIRGALKVPRATTLPTQSLLHQLVQEDISLDAEYQRGRRRYTSYTSVS